jgi:XTP/dITP diphosphohydrolase
LVNYARFLGLNPDDALERTNRKFIRRFQFMEKAAAEDKRQLSEMSLEEMDVYWERSKRE